MNDKTPSDLSDIERLLIDQPKAVVPSLLLDRLLQDVDEHFDFQASLSTPQTARHNQFKVDYSSELKWQKVSLATVALATLLFLSMAAFISNWNEQERLTGANAFQPNKQLTLVEYETDSSMIVPHAMDRLQFGNESILPHYLFDGELQRNLLNPDLTAWRRASVPQKDLSMKLDLRGASNRSLLIANNHQYESSVSNNWYQFIPVSRLNLTSAASVQLSAKIRTENASATNVCVQFWSSDHELVGFTSTPILRGTNRWQVIQSPKIRVPNGTKHLVVRSALTGIGKAWFRDVMLVELECHEFVAMNSSLRNSATRQEVGDDVEKWIGQLGTNETRRFEALNALIRLGEKAVGPLRRVLADQSLPLTKRWQATAALGGIGNRSAIEDLLMVFEVSRNESPVIKRVATDALIRFTDGEVRKRLEKIAEASSTDQQLREYIRDRLKNGLDNSTRRASVPETQPHPSVQTAWEKQFEWADSHKDVLEKAKAEGKLVMTIVHAFQDRKPNPNRLDPSAISYEVLMRGPMSDPDVVKIVRENFATRKVPLFMMQFGKELERNVQADPLSELGTSTREIQPTAILIHTSEGKLIQRMNAIGVFNSRLLHRALTKALQDQAIDPIPEKLVDVPDQLLTEHIDYWIKAKLAYLSGDANRALTILAQVKTDGEQTAIAKALAGKILHHEGQHVDARHVFTEAIEHGLDGGSHGELGETLYWMLDCRYPVAQQERLRSKAESFIKKHPDSIWAKSLLHRTCNPVIDLSGAESFDLSASPSELFGETIPETEFGAAVKKALRFLVNSQLENGIWRRLEGGQHNQKFTEPAITAICACAIHRWRLSGDLVKLPDRLMIDLKRSESLARGALRRYQEEINNAAMDYSQVFNQTYALEYYLDLLESLREEKISDAEIEEKDVVEMAQFFVDMLLRHQFKDGGWSYLRPDPNGRWGIRHHSFNTGPILIELARAKRLGLQVRLDEIKKGADSLLSLRAEDGAFAYAPGADWNWLTNHRAAIGRDTVCELGLFAVGTGNVEKIRVALERFRRYRYFLEYPRKLYGDSFNGIGHGSYFYAFAYYYACRALKHLPADRQMPAAREFQSELLAARELDGTWIDNHSQGKHYATAMVLNCLYATRRITD